MARPWKRKQGNKWNYSFSLICISLYFDLNLAPALVFEKQLSGAGRIAALRWR